VKFVVRAVRQAIGRCLVVCCEQKSRSKSVGDEFPQINRFEFFCKCKSVKALVEKYDLSARPSGPLRLWINLWDDSCRGERLAPSGDNELVRAARISGKHHD
jgi:hypothetical protein